MDLIDRKAAIEALGEEPEVWSGKDEYEQGLNNQWHYDVNAIKALPSAQPEIIRCKECKFYDHFWNGDWCSLKNIDVKDANDFCGRAKGKTDE